MNGGGSMSKSVDKAVALGLVGLGSYTLGVIQNPDTGFEQEMDLEFESENVSLSFVESIPGDDNLTGMYRHRDNQIFVRTGRSREKVLETCRHEFMHHFLFGLGGFEGEEKMVEKLDSRIRVPRCERTVAETDNYA
jgi:hypothetical protein